jgi:ArsR family transcriptional regulator
MARARIRGIPQQSINESAELLAVLGHPARLRIVELLHAEEMDVSQIAARLKVAHAVASQHLIRMHRAGVLGRQPVGRRMLYRVTHPDAVEILHWTHRRHFAHCGFEHGEAI